LIYQKNNLTTDQQVQTMKTATYLYQHSILDPKKKYISDYENIGDFTKECQVVLYSNKKKIISVFYILIANGTSPSVFLNSLKEYKPIIRDGHIHNPMCEYAKNDECDCPCNRKWHGLCGVGA
jgi:hypothetical protein